MTIDECLSRRAQDIIPTKEVLQKVLKSGKKIRLYQGFDPSSPNLHIGHLVGLLQLKSFQDLGHEVIFLIGDFTGMIGDPTDKTATRKKLTKKQVLANAKTYKEQAGKILDFKGENKALMKFNSTWLSKLNLADILELTSNFTVQQLIERDMFKQRLKENKPIYLHEFIYPLMVTQDAIDMDVDLEVGGNDQLFNMTIGRHLIKEQKNKEKYVITTKLLTDAQGQKIGKTTGNAINLFGDPIDLFGQIMALPDETIIPAFKLATTRPLPEIDNLQKQFKDKPMILKKHLAFEVTNLCHGVKKAKTAQKHFETVFQTKGLPTDMPKLDLKKLKQPINIIDLLEQTKLVDSRSEAKRLVEQGGVKLNQKKISKVSAKINLKKNDIIQLGKRRFLKFI